RYTDRLAHVPLALARRGLDLPCRLCRAACASSCLALLNCRLRAVRGPPEALVEPTGVLADLHALRRLAAERVQFSFEERGPPHPPPLLEILTAIVAAQERDFGCGRR